MADYLQAVVEKHNVFYEVVPYYVVQQEQRYGTARSTQKIQAGFDIDVYGTKESNEQRPARDYLLFCAALVGLINNLEPDDRSCSIQLVPFPSRVVIDTKRQFQELGMLRIRIAHRTLNEPAGPPEEHALKEIKERLDDLGISHR
ncbi:MAG TPA: hypothetical protein VFU50_11825 [Terriglobales bacterium]|nr:hypothetical protein [Terriglobales bacterium]